jgi:hypothetical protein
VSKKSFSTGYDRFRIRPKSRRLTALAEGISDKKDPNGRANTALHKASARIPHFHSIDSVVPK